MPRASPFLLGWWVSFVTPASKLARFPLDLMLVAPCHCVVDQQHVRATGTCSWQDGT